ncbi:Sensor histidine kinase RcsC [Dyadobacter sp. CECT 9275]|uniref:histidine kinase n=1 Tax=Dyadobacter helix TaxID=2822344 RepID=A0A916NBU0_9BACT|nr:PAS domain S-box protein [Dyadobacter sp. CECT 9275]CAG5000161.1 Sensor histidine kinase RcsC [Dyadobacter sp. CECT 9275]
MPEFSPLSHVDTSPGFWEWDLQGGSVLYNPILKESLGYAQDEFPDEWRGWRSLIHPEDLLKLSRNFRNYIQSKIEKPLVEEVRFIRKDGSVIYVLIIGKITQRADSGMPEKMVGSHIDITSQKRASAELTGVRNLLHETNHLAKVGGWSLDLQTNEIIWTDIIRVIFEVPADFVPIRGSVINFFKGEENRQMLRDAVGKSIASGESFNMELLIVTDKGREVWIRCMWAPEFEDGVCTKLYGAIQDINEQKLTEERLLLKEQQLATFIQHSPVALAMLDRNMNHIAASDIWKSFFGLEGIDIRGMNYYEIFPQTPEAWKQNHKRGLAGEVLRMDEDSFVLPDGKIEWLQWEVRPWYETNGEVAGIIIYTAVITEKHAYQEALILAKKQAEQALEMKSKFLSVMSHEMRTPLNAVIGFINLLLQDPRPDQLENMNILKFSAENLLILIDDILNFSKLDAGKVQLEQIDFNLNLLLHNITSSLQNEAAAKDLKLELITDSLIPEYVTGDPVRTTQVITNLVSNAIKFTPSGKVSLISTMKGQDKDTVTIGFQVVDTGIGIAMEMQGNIFEMFTQADSGTTRKYGGSGLGLTISKRILEIMGSEMHLSSRVGEGSTFSFDIVFRRGNKTSLAGASFEPDKVLKGAEILIVDDYPINVKVVKKFLDQWGCACTVASNGSVALEMVKSKGYDLILMDLQMPVMDGYEATRLIRKLPGEEFGKLPVIAISASSAPEVSARMIEAGMNDYISKPFNPIDLHNKLAFYLNKFRRF